MASLAARATHRLQAMASHVVSFKFKTLRNLHGLYKAYFFGFYANTEGTIGVERGSGIGDSNAQIGRHFVVCISTPLYLQKAMNTIFNRGSDD